jgi:hypothetical protein
MKRRMKGGPRNTIASLQVMAKAVELNLSAAASPARTSASPEKAQALKALARDYGASTPELLAKYDPATSSWRTSQLCLDGELSEFSETWPRSGLIRNGTAYQLPPLVRLTDEIGSGLWPTPDVVSAIHHGMITTSGGQMHLPQAVNAAQRARWPTPQARDWKDGNNPKRHGRHSESLAVSVALPTPTANRRNGLQSHGVNVVAGSLNPTWVEWLMGFPLEWTALGASAMQSFRKSRKSSGGRLCNR